MYVRARARVRVCVCVCMCVRAAAAAAVTWCFKPARLTLKGHVMAKQNVFQPQVNILIHNLIHYTTFHRWRDLGKNEVEWAWKAETK